jgi:hypothetical protein
MDEITLIFNDEDELNSVVNEIFFIIKNNLDRRSIGEIKELLLSFQVEN